MDRLNEEIAKEKVDKIFDRLEKAIDMCNDLDIADSVFHLGGYSNQLDERQFDKLYSLYRIFDQECECKKK